MEPSNLVFTGIIVQEDDAFVAYCTELDVVSQGETIHEAKEMLQEAVTLYMETRLDSEFPYLRPIPPGVDPSIERPNKIIERFPVKISVKKNRHLNQEEEKNKRTEVFEKLNSFQMIRSLVVHWITILLPWGILIFILVDLWVTRRYLPDDPLLFTGLLAVALAGFIYRTLLNKVPEFMKTLFLRKVLGLKTTGEDSRRNKNPFASIIKRVYPKLSEKFGEENKIYESVEAKFHEFLTDFEDSLNSQASSLLGLLFAIAIYFSFLYRWEVGPTFNWVGSLIRVGRWDHVIGIFAQFVMAYVLGLLAWRMIVIAQYISRLGRNFDLDIQLQHPDRSGGLKPLGEACFLNALIISVPNFFLAIWLIVIPRVAELNDQYFFWIPFYNGLLLFAIGLAFFTFIQPLYSVHQEMVKERDRVYPQLDELSFQIDELAKTLLNDAHKLSAEESEELQKKLDLMKQVYKNNTHIPIWPFDISILARFIFSQALPSISLVLGVVDSIEKTITS